jgi:phage terminase large subunit-like protein
LEIQTEYGIYIPWVGYDRYSAIYWVEEMQGHLGKNAMEVVAQGKQTLSGPMKLLGADLKAKMVNYNNNQIDKWCLSNTAIDVDLKNQTIQPHKGKNQRKRIDGTAALLDAYVALERHREEYMNLI